MKRMRPTNPAAPTDGNSLPRLDKPRSGRGADFAQKYGRAPTERELQWGRPLSSEGLGIPPLNKKALKELQWGRPSSPEGRSLPPLNKSSWGTAKNPINRGEVPTGRVGPITVSGSIGPTTAAPPVPTYDDPTGAVLGYRTGTTAALGGGMGMNEDQYSVRRRLLGA